MSTPEIKVPLAKPWLTASDQTAVMQAITNRWPGQGPITKHLEAKIEEKLGVSHAIALHSGTSALHLALLATGVGKGDQVAVPAFGFLSTANVIEMVGAKPIFVDIEQDGFNLCFDSLKASTSSIQAVMAVHQFGLALDVSSVRKIAGDKVAIIEDAACAFGVKKSAKALGTFGDVGCFSFHPRKITTSGEGGAITTNDASLAEKAMVMRSHGIVPGRDGVHATLGEMKQIGFNYRISDLQAGLLLGQCERIEEILKQRQQLAQSYRDGLSDEDWLQIPEASEEHAWQSYVVRLATPDNASEQEILKVANQRDRILHALANAGIGSRAAGYAIHALDYYREKYALGAMDYPNAFRAAATSFALPIFHEMRGDEQEMVVAAVKECKALIQ